MTHGELAAFRTALLHEVTERGGVLTATVAESEHPDYPDCFHVRAENGTCCTQVWISCEAVRRGFAAPMVHIVGWLIYRLRG